MSTITPALLVGRSMATASPLIGAQSSLLHGSSQGSAIDAYHDAGLRPDSNTPPSPASVSRLEDAVVFGPPDLRTIHLSGCGANPEPMLAQFPEVRRIKNGRFDALALLWRQHDDEVNLLNPDRTLIAEFLDPERPLHFDEECAELANLPARYRRDVVALHHAIRKSLAAEQMYEAVLRKDIRYRIRYQLTTGSEPVRDGTVAVSLSAIQSLIDRYERFSRPLSGTSRAQATKGLILLEAARGFQNMRGWTHPLSIEALTERLFARWTDAERKRLVFFQTVLEFGKSGLALRPGRYPKNSYWSLFKRIAESLGHPMEEMIRQVMGPAVERWKKDAPLRMDFLKDLISLTNFLGMEDAWKLLWRLHSDELSWAFQTRSDHGGVQFLVDSESDLERLRVCGFGGLLNSARLERGWNLPALREAVIPHFGGEMSLSRLGDLASNREQPDFRTLVAVVEALNSHEAALPVDSAEAFLASYPTFIDLLPLAARDGSGVLRNPSRGPVYFVAYPRPVERGSVVVTRREEPAPANPDGLPYLLRSARTMRGLSLMAASELLGISHETLRRYENEETSKDRSLPGRMTIEVVCSARGYGLSREKVLAAHLSSYWSDVEAVKVLQSRTFNGPVYIEENSAAQVRDYASASRTTPGECLFYWRNGIPTSREIPFLPSESEFASWLDVPVADYRRWESNISAPEEKTALALGARLGRREEEIVSFLTACRELRASKIEVRQQENDWPWASAYPNLRHFEASLPLKAFFREKSQTRFREKLESLKIADPGSLEFLEERATGELDRSETARILGSIHRAEEKARLWPKRIQRNGPIAAFAYYHRGTAKKSWDRLERALRNPRVTAVSFSPEDGSCVITGLAPRGKAAARIKFSSKIPEGDVATLTALIRRMKREGRLNNQSRTKAFLKRLACIAEHDPVSYRDFVASAVPTADLSRLSNALEFTARFIVRWKGHFTWTGSVYRYYTVLEGRRSALMYLRNRLARGQLKAAHFDEGRVSFESLQSVRRTARRGGEARTYSYADAASVTFLPNPQNQWGRKDLAMSWGEVQARVRAFFESLESRLKKDPIEIQRDLGRTYYQVRTGADVLGGEHLSDEVLDRLALDSKSKEELRHLQTLLVLSRGEGDDRESGLYAGPGRVLRYYRLLHQMTLSEVKPMYRGGSAVAGPADYEYGRVGLEDRKRLGAIAEGLGIPKMFRSQLIDALLAEYHRLRSQAERRGFPIPHETWSESDALEALKAMAIEARGALSRPELARKTGLTASQQYKFENHGEISEEAWPVYRAHLEATGQRALAHRIRLARAALDMRRKPLESGGSFHPAGRWLRFTRFAMIGMPIQKVIEELRLKIDPQVYLRWELGLNRMPDSVLRSYLSLLEKMGVVRRGEIPALERALQESYAC